MAKSSFGLGHVYVRVRNRGVQTPLPAPRQRLPDHQHVLRRVVVPGLLQRNTPAAIHELGIVECPRGRYMRFGRRNVPDRDVNLRILSQRDSLHLIESQSGTRVCGT